MKRLLISTVHFQPWLYHKSLSNTYFMLHMIHKDTLEPQNDSISSKSSTTFKAWERKDHATSAKSWLYKNPTVLTYIKILHKLQDHISIDLLGSYNITSQGNSYILTAVCNLTGYVMVTPYQRQKDNDSSDPLVFGHYVKIQFPQNTTFW